MAYRDKEALYRDRIDELELELVKTAGRGMLATDERDRLRAELDRLTNDPRALRRARSAQSSRRALYWALRALGILMLLVTLAPLLATALVVLASGEILAGLMCTAIPLATLMGMLLLKLPDIVTWLELRHERKQRQLRKLQSQQKRVRVDLGYRPYEEHDVGDEVEAAEADRPFEREA